MAICNREYGIELRIRIRIVMAMAIGFLERYQKSNKEIVKPTQTFPTINPYINLMI